MKIHEELTTIYTNGKEGATIKITNRDSLLVPDLYFQIWYKGEQIGTFRAIEIKNVITEALLKIMELL